MYEMGSHFSKDFSAALNRLPLDLATNTSVNIYRQFVDTFGTHVPIGITLGGVATEISPFVDGKLDLVAAASAGLLKSGAKSSFLYAFGAKASASLDGDARLIFDGSRQQNHTVCRPLCPPLTSAAETQSTQWSDSLTLPANRAIPVKYNLIPISVVIAAKGKLNVAENLVKYINTWYATNTTQCEAPPSLSYDNLPGLTVNRTDAGAVSLADGTGNVYIAGGFTKVSLARGNGEATDLVEYTRGNGWSIYGQKLPNGPLARFVSVALGTKWYLMGGVSSTSSQPKNETVVFDAKDHEWSVAYPEMNVARSQACGEVYNGAIYVFGGMDTTKSCTTSFESMKISSGSTGAWTLHPEEMPECRVGATGTVTTEGIYIAGGFTKVSFGFGISPASTVIAWNGHWTSISQMPYGVALHSALFQNNVFSIYGGQSNENDPKFAMTARTLSFDLKERSWRAGIPLPAPQTGADAIIFENKPWLLGGTRCYLPITGNSGTNVKWGSQASCIASGTVNTAIPMNDNQPIPVACPEDASANAFSLSKLKNWAASLANTFKHAASPPPPPPSAAFMNLPNLPNVEIVGRGIDLSMSDPDSTSLEPGLRQDIFNVLCDSTCYSLGKSLSRKFKIPDVISAREDHRCSYVVDTDIIHSTFDMQQHLNYWTKTKTRKLFWSHTDSSSMQEAESYTANSDHVMVVSKSQCSVYHASLDMYSMKNATLTNSFANAVRSLPTSYNSPGATNQLSTFVQTFGTHVVNEASFGGFAKQTTIFEQQDIATLHSENNDVGGNAGLHFLENFKQGAPSGFPTTGPYGRYKNLIKDSNIVTVPVTPPMGNGQNTSAQLWLDSLLDSPALIRTNVLPLSTFFTSDLFPNEKEEDLEKKVEALNQYMYNSICTDGTQCIRPQNATHGLVSPPMPQPLAGSPALFIDGQVYFFGGATTGKTNDASKSFQNNDLSDNAFATQRFDIVNESWQYLPPMRNSDKKSNGCTIFSGAALTSEGYGIVAGRCGVSQFEVQKLTGKGLTAGVAPLEKPRILFRLVSVTSKDPNPNTQKKVNTFAIGGISTDGANTVLDSVEAYVPLSNGGSEWVTSIQNMKTARHSFSTVIVDDCIWMIGGLDTQNNILASIEIYTVSTNKWSYLNEPIPAAASPRYGHESVYYDDAIYIMGGCTTVNDCAPTNSVARYAIKEHGWKVVQSIYSRTVYFSAVLVPQSIDSTFDGVHVKIFGGLDQNGSPSNQTSTYQIPKGILSSMGKRAANVKRRSTMNTTVQNGASNTVNPTAIQHKRARTRNSSTGLRGNALSRGNIVPGIEYLGYGYNILRGNPLASAFEDDGWQTTPILRVDDLNLEGDDNITAGGFVIPDGVGVNFLRSCTFDSTQSIIRGTADLQAHLGAYANGKARVGFPFLFDLHFRLSGDFNVHASTIGTEEFVYVTSQSSCEFYKMSLNQFSKVPQYTTEFLEGLKQLPLTLKSVDDTTAYYDFVETFGTHVPYEITMGAYASMWNQIETTKFDLFAQGDASISEGSKKSFLFFYKKTHEEGGSFSISEREAFQEIVTHNSTNCKPTCPPLFTGELDTSAWMNQVERNQNMVPIKWDLATIPELLRNQPPPFDVSVQMDLMTTFLNGPYCTLAGCPKSPKKVHWRRFADLKSSVLFPKSGISETSPQTLGVGLVNGDLTVTSLNGVQRMNRFANVVVPTKGLSGAQLWATDDALKLNNNNRVYSDNAMNNTRMQKGFSIQVGHTVYMFGGILKNFTKQTPTQIANTVVYSYNLDVTGPSAWSQSNEVPASAISSGSATSVGDTIVVVGGIKNGIRLDVCTTFNTSSGVWKVQTANMNGEPGNRARSDTTAVAVGDQVYVFGGQTDNATVTSDVLLYDVNNDNWLPVGGASLPAPIRGASGVLVSRGIIIAGGFSVNSNSRTPTLTTAVYLFEPGTNAFTVMAPLAIPSAHAVSLRNPSDMNNGFAALFVGGITAECEGGQTTSSGSACPSNQVQILSLTV